MKEMTAEREEAASPPKSLSTVGERDNHFQF